jgi:hypothetical protein
MQQRLNVFEDVTFVIFGGIRSLLSQQKFNQLITLDSIYYQDDENVHNYLISTLNEFNKFTGAGALTGLEVSCLLRYGFEVYTNLSASILWGWFSIKQTVNTSETFLNTNTNILVEDESENYSRHANIFNYEMGLGIKWNFTLQNDLVVSLKLGWEQHLYGNLNQFRSFITQNLISQFVYRSTQVYKEENIQRGNLYLSGIKLGLSIVY